MPPPNRALIVAMLALNANPAVADSWWDDAWAWRVPLEVRTRGVAPSAGYQGYTLRLDPFSTDNLMRAGMLRLDCADLRVVRHGPGGPEEIPRLVTGCGSPATKVLFAAAADMPADGVDRSYSLYLGNPEPPPPPADPRSVFLWADLGDADRSSAYGTARLPDWAPNAVEDAIRYDDAVGAYRYAVPDDSYQVWLLPAGGEDLLLEVSLDHRDCQPLNMRTALLVGVRMSDEGIAEERLSALRAWQARCGGGYSDDATLAHGGRVIAAGRADAVRSGWRRMAVSYHGRRTPELRFFDGEWSLAGWPDADQLLVARSVKNPPPPGGAVGLVLSQDSGLLDDIVLRRFVDPEPDVSVSAPSPRIITIRRLRPEGMGERCGAAAGATGGSLRVPPARATELSRGFTLRLRWLRGSCVDCRVFELRVGDRRLLVLEGDGDRLRLRSGDTERRLEWPTAGDDVELVYDGRELAWRIGGEVNRRSAVYALNDTPATDVRPQEPLVRVDALLSYPTDAATVDAALSSSCPVSPDEPDTAADTDVP